MSVTLDLAGQRVLVVGASSGVGREVALTAGRAGARVALAARRLERLREAAAELGDDALAITCDVRDPDDCRRGVAEAAGSLGGLDGLVYAAGVSPVGFLEVASAEDWRRVLETNLIGAALVTAAALPHLRESRGCAVFVSSYAVRQSLPGLGLYSTSKVALDGLVAAWRADHPELDFTRVVLGTTSGTEFDSDWDAEKREQVVRLWLDRNVFPASKMMPLEAAAEAIAAVLAVRGYVDDIAIMPRTSDGEF